PRTDAMGLSIRPCESAIARETAFPRDRRSIPFVVLRCDVWSVSRRRIFVEQCRGPTFKIKSQLFLSEVPLLVHKPRCRDAENTVARCELIPPAFPIKMLRPWQFLFLDESA